jgi:WD40 repeat protein
MIDSLTYLVVRKQAHAHDSAVYSLAARDNLLASGDDEGTVKLWDLRQKSLASQFDEQEGFVAQLLFVPSSPHELIAVGSCGYVASLDIRKGQLIARSDPVSHEPTCATLTKADGLLIVGTEEGTLEIFHTGDWAEPLSSVNLSSGSDMGVQSLQTLSLNHSVLFAGSDDGFVRVLSIEPTTAAEVLVEHVGASVERMAISRDRQLLGSVGQDKMLKFSPIGHLFAENEVVMERRTAATRKQQSQQFFAALDEDDNDNNNDNDNADDDDDSDL